RIAGRKRRTRFTAASLCGGRRFAMRLLHCGLRHVGQGFSGRKSCADSRRYQKRYVRKSVPLWDIRRHRGSAPGCEPDESSTEKNWVAQEVSWLTTLGPLLPIGS